MLSGLSSVSGEKRAIQLLLNKNINVWGLIENYPNLEMYFALIFSKRTLTKCHMDSQTLVLLENFNLSGPLLYWIISVLKERLTWHVTARWNKGLVRGKVFAMYNVNPRSSILNSTYYAPKTVPKKRSFDRYCLVLSTYPLTSP